MSILGSVVQNLSVSRPVGAGIYSELSYRMALKTSSTGKTAPQLLDPFGRSIDYVRLSVTDKCNLRCFYCLPEGFRAFEEPEHWLRFDEVERVIGAFAELGVSRVRLTGGEPLVRRDLPQLAANLAALPGVDDLSLSTNATLLSRDAVALG